MYVKSTFTDIMQGINIYLGKMVELLKIRTETLLLLLGQLLGQLCTIGQFYFVKSVPISAKTDLCLS